MQSNNWKRFAFFHKMMHRCDNWYLNLIKKHIVKQICFVWILSLKRKWKRNTLTIRFIIYWFYKYFKYFILHCVFVDSIFMWFDCKKLKKYVIEMKKMKNNRKIDKKNNASNARQIFANIYRYKKYKFEFFDFD